MASGPGRAVAGGRVAKSAEAFRTISEVAEELDLPQHVLRFWETRFSQIRPLKRGGGRRYYRPADVDLLRQIRDLLYVEGYTIKGAQKLLRSGQAKAAASARPAAAQAATPNAAPAASRDPAPAASGNGGEAAGELEGAERAQLEAVLDELVQLRALLRQAAG